MTSPSRPAVPPTGPEGAAFGVPPQPVPGGVGPTPPVGGGRAGRGRRAWGAVAGAARRVNAWADEWAYSVGPDDTYMFERPETPRSRRELPDLPSVARGDERLGESESGAASRERRRQAVVDMVAERKYRLETAVGTGRRRQRAWADALAYVDHYLRDDFLRQADTDEGLTETDMVRQRFQFFEDVADRQIAIAVERRDQGFLGRLNRVAGSVMNFLRNPWVRYSIPAAALTAVIASILVPGGPVVAAILAAGLKAMPWGLGIGAFGGALAGVPTGPVTNAGIQRVCDGLLTSSAHT